MESSPYLVYTIPMWLFGKKKQRSDEELASLYHAWGDQAVFGELFEKHLRTVYGACLFYFRDKATAEDITMQVFEKLMIELRKTKPNNFKGWLSFVVRNYCINALKKQQKNRMLGDEALEKVYTHDELELEEQAIIEQNEKMLDVLNVALPLLKEAQRNCVQAFYLQKQSYEQIAAQYNMSLNEVKSHIQNGKRNLKLSIEEKLKQNEKH